MRPLLVALAFLLATVAPVQATPFDFSADYNWQWDLAGPVLLIGGGEVGVAMSMRPVPLGDPREPVIHFTLAGDFLPPVRVGGTLTWDTLADIRGSQCNDGPFACSYARFSLVGERDGWALVGWRDEGPDLAATPEPTTLLLLGATLAAVGWRVRRGK